MKKIKSLFVRNYDSDYLCRNEIAAGSEWVIRGEGTPTRKLDGTCCMVRDGKLFLSYEIKKGDTSHLIPDFEPTNEIDPITGKQKGWRSISPSDKWHHIAFDHGVFENGTYELVGPKVQKNPEGYLEHVLIKHGSIILSSDTPRSYEGLKIFLADNDIEGIVWHHPDGRMVKIKKRDFGYKR